MGTDAEVPQNPSITPEPKGTSTLDEIAKRLREPLATIDSEGRLVSVPPHRLTDTDPGFVVKPPSSTLAQELGSKGYTVSPAKTGMFPEYGFPPKLGSLQPYATKPQQQEATAPVPSAESPAEPPASQTPEKSAEINPSIDPFDGAQKALENNRPEEFKTYLQRYLKEHPGGISPEEMFGMAVSAGEMPDRIKQAIEWSQEARILAIFGPKGEDIYRQLRDAAKKGNKELFDKIRTQEEPNVGKIADMLGKDLQLGDDREASLNMMKLNGPHKTNDQVKAALGGIRQRNV